MSVTPPRIYNVKTNLPVSALYHLPTAPLAPPDSSHGGPWSAVEDPNSGSAHRYCAAAWKPGLRRGAARAPAAVSVGARHHSEPQNGVNVAAGTTARKSAQVCVGARDSWDRVPDPLEGWNVRMYIYGGGVGALVQQRPERNTSSRYTQHARPLIYKPTDINYVENKITLIRRHVELN